MVSHTYRATLDHHIQSTDDVAQEAYALFLASYHWQHPLRSITVGISGLEEDSTPCQLDMLESGEREKRERLDRVVDDLRERFGDTCIRRAILLEEPELTGFSPYDDHTVHPVGFSGKTDKIGGQK